MNITKSRNIIKGFDELTAWSTFIILYPTILGYMFSDQHFIFYMKNKKTKSGLSSCIVGEK